MPIACTHLHFACMQFWITGNKCNNNGVCDNGEDCHSCQSDCGGLTYEFACACLRACMLACVHACGLGSVTALTINSDCRLSLLSNGATCGNGICEAGNDENCATCAADCAGQLGGTCCGLGPLIFQGINIGQEATLGTSCHACILAYLHTCILACLNA